MYNVIISNFFDETNRYEAWTRGFNSKWNKKIDFDEGS